jgi:D-aminopeptidase
MVRMTIRTRETAMNRTAPYVLLVATLLAVCASPSAQVASSSSGRVRDHGIRIGRLPPGPLNAITDVEGVRVGHATLIRGDDVRTGVTAILPHAGNLFLEKVPAAVHVGNGFGKLVGALQVAELGELETPILLTNTLNVWRVADSLVTYMLALDGMKNVRSINPVVGETNDGRLNDIRGRHVDDRAVREALTTARTGPVEEGAVGAGTGTVCFGFKGGIGTASRRVSRAAGVWRVGVLVQSNYGGDLHIAGVPVGRQLPPSRKDRRRDGGSCMVVIATDAPLGPRNLGRLARRAVLGLGRTGSVMANGSGDFVIAFTTHPECRIAHGGKTVRSFPALSNRAMTGCFQAAVEATEEAVLNSLFAARTVRGFGGREVRALPVERVVALLRAHGVIRDADHQR